MCRDRGHSLHRDLITDEVQDLHHHEKREQKKRKNQRHFRQCLSAFTNRIEKSVHPGALLPEWWV